MTSDPALSLRKVVEDDPEKGRSTTEFIIRRACQIDFAIQLNFRAWTRIRHNSTAMYVKESPDEILTKIERAIEETRRLYGGRTVIDMPEFRVYQDTDKCVLINLSHVRTICKVSDYKTKFNFNKGNIVINLPIDLLNVPATKTKG